MKTVQPTAWHRVAFINVCLFPEETGYFLTKETKMREVTSSYLLGAEGLSFVESFYEPMCETQI